jgi:hypothetical protein
MVEQALKMATGYFSESFREIYCLLLHRRTDPEDGDSITLRNVGGTVIQLFIASYLRGQ